MTIQVSNIQFKTIKDCKLQIILSGKIPEGSVQIQIPSIVKSYL